MTNRNAMTITEVDNGWIVEVHGDASRSVCGTIPRHRRVYRNADKIAELLRVLKDQSDFPRITVPVELP